MGMIILWDHAAPKPLIRLEGDRSNFPSWPISSCHENELAPVNDVLLMHGTVAQDTSAATSSSPFARLCKDVRTKLISPCLLPPLPS